MYKTYREIQSRIEKIELSNLWPGFTPYEFALYDDDWCLDIHPVVTKIVDELSLHGTR